MTVTSVKKRKKEIASEKPAVLLVQTNSEDGEPLRRALRRSGLAVVAASNVKEALLLLSSRSFEALVCDLHLPCAGDGFTLVNATRHCHPDAVTIIMSDYPALKESLSALLPQADEILVTPLPSSKIVALLKNRLREPRHRPVNPFEPAAAVLQRHSAGTIAEWLTRVNAVPALQKIPLTPQERTGHLPALLNDLVLRLRAPRVEEGKAKVSLAALAHGRARRHQGYVAEMLVEESRILQVCIFTTLRNNLSALDLALVLTDVMTIADEVDSQLRQTMAGFAEEDSGQDGVNAA